VKGEKTTECVPGSGVFKELKIMVQRKG